jgi:catechol 2,3-dioxygenase-like lactoylglutathione lyase family enzyme
MRLRGVNHVDLCVLDYENALAFYDRMFGWLGYKSFGTGGVSYEATYYVAFPHSYIGIHPAGAVFAERLDHRAHAPGLHHFALWARSRREVDRFYDRFLVPNGVEVTEAPVEYPLYTPGYYAVFFLDPTGIRWEFARLPFLPTPGQIRRFLKTLRAVRAEHPEWEQHPAKAMWRKLPGRGRAGREP